MTWQGPVKGLSITVVGRESVAVGQSLGTNASDSQTVSLRAEVTRGAQLLRPGEFVQVRLPMPAAQGWTSAAQVVSAVPPRAKLPPSRSIYERTTRGARIYLATPRLRGLLALNLAIASGSAMMIVNTVVLVQSGLGLTQKATAMALAAFGVGSMLVALTLPKLPEKLPERRVMLAGASLIALGLFAGAAAPSSYLLLLSPWFVMGVGKEACVLESVRVGDTVPPL